MSGSGEWDCNNTWSWLNGGCLNVCQYALWFICQAWCKWLLNGWWCVLWICFVIIQMCYVDWDKRFRKFLQTDSLKASKLDWYLFGDVQCCLWKCRIYYLAFSVAQARWIWKVFHFYSFSLNYNSMKLQLGSWSKKLWKLQITVWVNYNDVIECG